MKPAILLLCLLMHCIYLNAQIDFSLNLEPGQRYSFSTWQKITVIESPNGIENKTATTVDGSYNYMIVEKYDTGYLVRVEFTALNQKVESAEGVTFNGTASDDTTACVTKVFKQIVNKPFTVFMDKEYNWKKVIGLDAVFREGFNSCALTEAARKIVDSVLTEEIKGFVQDGSMIPLGVYSANSKKPNETWVEFDVTEHVVPTQDSCSYLVEIYGDDIIVKGTGTSKSLENEVIKDGQATAFFLSGPIDYKVVFDKQSKWITNAGFTITLTGKANVKKPGSILKQIVPMTVITEATVQGKRIK